MSLVSVLVLGFLLGLRHATDPDHVVAVGTILSRSPGLRPAARIGACWGLGHALAIVAFGSALVLLRIAIPPRLGLSLELAVALMLIVLGISNVLGARRSHDHALPAPPSAPGRASGVRSALVGWVHGLSGSAAVAVLAAGAMSDARGALVYLATFGAGTLAGMTLLTTAFALPMSLGAARLRRRLPSLVAWAGFASVGLGVVLAHRIGTDGGLFSAAPSWAPN